MADLLSRCYEFESILVSGEDRLEKRPS